MPRILSAGVFRLDSASSLISLGEYTGSNDTAYSLFDALNIRQILLQRIHLHFNNKDFIQLEKHSCYLSLLVNDPLTLLFVCIAEPTISPEYMDGFLDRFQDTIMRDKTMFHRFAATDEKLRNDLSIRIAHLLMVHGNDEGADRLAEIRQQVESVKTVMSNNMQRVLERGERLDNIEGRTEALTQSSQNFKFTAHRVQRRMCLRNAKWTIIIAVCTAVAVIIIILIILNEAGVFNHN